MTRSATIVGKFFLSLCFEIVTAPLWWYTGGVVWIISRVGASIRDAAAQAALGLWIKNVFVPMYGQHDTWGRIVSFIIRVANIIARGVWVALWAVVCVTAFGAWVAAPAITFYYLVFGTLVLFQ